MPLEQSETLKELGRLAAERREEANLTLQDVYERTKIRLEYLKGIEAGNYQGFPELVYIRGFIRTYLKFIGAVDLEDDFMAQLGRSNTRKQQDFTAASTNILGNGTVQRGFKPVSHMWLFVVLIAALIGTGIYVWYALSNGGFNLDNLKWPNFAGINSNEQQNNEPPVNAEAEAENNILLASGDNKEPEKTPEPPKLTPYIEIRAQNDVWMSVSIGDNNVFRRTLRRGGAVSWDLNGNNARVTYGRPNAAQVILNGKNLGLANPRATKKAETYIYFPDGTSRRSGNN